jgi:hypothetical protein
VLSTLSSITGCITEFDATSRIWDFDRAHAGDA